MNQAGGKAVLFQADVSKEDEVLSMFTRMIVELGRIDILINNSGIQPNAPFDEMTLQQWQRVIDINLRGSSSAPVKRYGLSSARGSTGKSPAPGARSSISARCTT